MNKLQKSIAAFWPFWILVIGVIWMGAKMGESPKASTPAVPKVEPVAPPCPPDKPWGLRNEASVDAVVAPDGTEPEVEYPGESWMANIGSRKDGAGMCIAGDTLINTRQGMVSICDLVSGRHEIYFHHKNGHVSWTTKFDVRRTGRVKRLRVIEMDDGRFVRATGNHRFAVSHLYTENPYEWVEASQVSADYHVATLLPPDLRERGTSLVMRNVAAVSWERVEGGIDVYDIENFEECYAGEGNFFANGLLVHNCVFTSFEMMCRHAGLEEFRGFRDWCAAGYPGGGAPEKLARLVTAYCTAKRIPVPRFYQYEGADLAFLETALRTGRFACVTLYHSARYGGRIYHMVNCGHAAGPRYRNIVDNNRMRNDGIPPVEWFDGVDRFKHAVSINGRYWAVVLERPGLPAPPKN